MVPVCKFDSSLASMLTCQNKNRYDLFTYLVGKWLNGQSRLWAITKENGFKFQPTFSIFSRGLATPKKAMSVYGSVQHPPVCNAPVKKCRNAQLHPCAWACKSVWGADVHCSST